MSIRKILVPVVAGLFISPALMAADVENESDSLPYSNEYLSTAAPADVVIGGVLGVALGAEYAVGDIITLTFTGDALDDSTLATSIIIAGDATFSGVTLGLLSSTSGQAIYRVTEIDTTAGGTTTVGVVVEFADFGDLEFSAQDLAAAGVVIVSFAAETDSGLALDTGGGTDRSTEYLTTDDQFSAAMDTSFDQIVDVNQNREGFANGSCCDFAQVGLDEDFGFFGAASLVDQDVVWDGDFSWIFDDDEVADDIQPLPGVVIVSCAAPADVTVTASSISYTCPFGGISWVQLNVDANVDMDGNLAVLPATSYTVSVTVNFVGFSATEGSVSFSGIDAGQWLLNGFQALLPYVPYSNAIGQVIYLVNRGIQAGDVTVDWIDQGGNTGSLGTIGTLGPTTTMSIGPTIKGLLPQALQDGGRLALTITVNAPANDVQINSQYNVSGDRAFIDTETNRGDNSPR